MTHRSKAPSSSSSSTSTSLKVGQRVKVVIQGIGSFGEGLARIDRYEIFVPKTAPQDEVEIVILEKKKGRYRAEVVQLLKPSPQRVEPRCPHFLACGGCDFQHLSYEQQMSWKMRMSRHWIRRSPLEPFFSESKWDSIESPLPYGYRHRARLQVQDGKLHFFYPHSNRLLPLQECPILVPGFFEKIAIEAKEVQNAKDWNRSFTTSYQIDGSELQFDETCFTQANFAVNELMVKRVLEDLSLVQNKGQALDLYCGIGNFSIPLSQHFKKVVGVEMEGSSLNWARKNSSAVDWIAGSSEAATKKFVQQKSFFNFILMDPPRTGASALLTDLIRLRPEVLTYVSCSLQTLIPDLTQLVKKGPFQIQRWTTVDLFPQTHHIESIVTLVPK